MKILVLCDDYYHPAHVPRAGLAMLGSDEFHFDWIENAHAWSAERMAAYSLVILTKSNNVTAVDRTKWMTDRVQTDFVDYVRRGNGLLAIHSGPADYEQAPRLRRLLGGVFTHHPDQCPVTVFPASGHPLAAGCDSYTLTDEHYHMTMDDPKVDVFLTTISDHGEQPGGWRRTEGAGRVVVLTPSHNLEGWQHPSFQILLRNAMRWCGQII